MPAEDFGDLFCPRGADAFWSVWCATYEEARSIRQQRDGYLLTYRQQYFIVDRHYIRFLGLDPEDPDWEAIDRDWAHPRDPAARERLHLRLLIEARV